MAYKTFHFPTSSTSYNLPSGDTIRFEIFRDNVSTVNVNMGSKISKIYPLQYRLESKASDDEMNYAAGKIDFTNDSNEFITNTVFDSNYENELFIKIEINSSEVFLGLILFDKVAYKKPYLDGSDVKHRIVSIKFVDVLKRLEFKTVNDMTFSDGDTLATVLGNILVELDVGYTASEVSIDGSFAITPWYTDEPGNPVTNPLYHGYSYDEDDLRIATLDTALSLSTLLKQIMLIFGMFIYNREGKIVFSVRDSAASPLSVDNNLIIKIDRLQNYQPIDYIGLSCTIDWNDVDATFYNEPNTEQTYSRTAGTQGVDSGRDKSVDLSALLSQIYTHDSGRASHRVQATQTRINDTSMSLDIDCTDSGKELEAGNMIEYNGGGTADFAPVEKVEYVSGSECKIFITDIGGEVVEAGVLLAWVYWRETTGDNTLPLNMKLLDILQGTKNIYDTFYRTSPEVYKLVYPGYSTDVDKPLSMLSNTYRAFEAKYDFVKNQTEFLVRQVA